MSDEDNLIQFLERREIKVNRESEGYTVHTTRTSLDSEELEHIISLGRIFAMNVDYDSRSIYIGIKKKANIQDSEGSISEWKFNFLKVEYRNTSKILEQVVGP